MYHTVLYPHTHVCTHSFHSLHTLSPLSGRALPPGPSPAPSAPVPAPHRALRLGTFNVGLGFLRKLPHILTRCAALALDVVALQEVGDPALLSTRLSPYLLAYAAGPSHHEAGVGLLLSQELAPRIRCYKRSSSGRLIAAVLELSPGQRTLLVSAYMPSGLDHRSADSPQHELAHKLYGELLRWSLDAQQVIVMGDLNETLTPLDRLPGAAAAAGPPRPLAAALSPIRCLLQQCFTDVTVICIRSSRVSPTASLARVPCRAGSTTSGAKATALRPCCASALTQRCTCTDCCGWSSAWPILLHRTAPPIAPPAPAQPPRSHRRAQRRVC